MKRYYLILSGQVQGVGMRYHLTKIAESYNITGFCRNMQNGNVEVEFQGEDTDLFLKEVLKKRGFIRIDNYQIKEIPLKEETGFNVRF